MICTRCELDGAGLRFVTDRHGAWWFHAPCWMLVRWAMARHDGADDFAAVVVDRERRSLPIISLAKLQHIIVENEAKMWDSSVESAERANARPTLTTTLPHEVRHGMATHESNTSDE